MEKKEREYQVQPVRIFTGFWAVYILSYVLPSGEITGVPVQKTLLIMLLAVSLRPSLIPSRRPSLIPTIRPSSSAFALASFAKINKNNDYMNVRYISAAD